jgi:hypothetical protein
LTSKPLVMVCVVPSGRVDVVVIDAGGLVSVVISVVDVMASERLLRASEFRGRPTKIPSNLPGAFAISRASRADSAAANALNSARFGGDNRDSRLPVNNISAASSFRGFSKTLRSYSSQPCGDSSFAVNRGIEKLLISCSMIPIICNSCIRHRGLHCRLTPRRESRLCSQYETSSQCGRAYVQSENKELLSLEKDVDRLPRDSRSRTHVTCCAVLSSSLTGSRYRNSGTECNGIRPRQTKSIPTPSLIRSSVVRSSIDLST